MVAFSTYAYGTVSVADGMTTVSGDGAIWSGVNARAGDSISIDGGLFNKISDVTDETHLELATPQGGDKTDVPYVILWDSPLRFTGAQARADLTTLLSTLKAKGLLWYLADGLTKPDDAAPPLTADEGQGILQISSGKLWVMQSGAWVFVGVQKALGVATPWSSATTYNVNDVVSLSGTSYVCILANTNETPPNATYWTVLAAKGDTGATGPASLKPIAAWVTATAYVTGPPASFVSQSGSSYECLIAHTSGTFATDLAAAKWGLVTSKGADGLGTGDMSKADNLSGLSDIVASRHNIYAAPFDALAYNGMQVNGGVDVSQELGVSGATLSSGSLKYTADSWFGAYTHAAGTAVITSGQVAASSFPAALSGYSFGHQIKATTALTSPANNDYAAHNTYIEGYRVARLGWGASGAQSLSYGFQFYATASGTILVRFENSASNRAYHQEQVVAAGWNWLTGTIPGDTTGTWVKNSGIGLIIRIFSAGKAASPATPGAWSATPAVQSTNSTNLLASNNNLTIATGLIVVPGTELPSSSRAPLIMRPYDQELALCRRQFRLMTPSGAGISSGTVAVFFMVAHEGMRIAPTVSAKGTLRITDVFTANFDQTTANATISSNTSEAGLYTFGNFTGLTTGRLYVFQNASSGAAGGQVTFDARL